MVSRVVRWVAGCVLVTGLLVACAGEGEGGSGDRPSLSPTASPDLPSPTKSLDLPSPTRSRSDAPDTPEPTPDEETTEAAPDEETTEAAPDESPEQSQAPESSPTANNGDAKADDTDATPSDDDESTPSWVWWLIGLAVVAIGALVIWLVTRSKKRNAWQADLREAEAEVDWFAHTLLTGLRSSGSLEQVVGGWHVGATRVAAVEDRLTVLESSASQDEDRIRARGLRDAVRLARGRMEELATPGPHDSWALDLDDTIANLETAFGPTPPAQPAA
jgi:hypothetical protein